MWSDAVRLSSLLNSSASPAATRPLSPDGAVQALARQVSAVSASAARVSNGDTESMDTSAAGTAASAGGQAYGKAAGGWEDAVCRTAS
ncbi:hypothetical protein ACWDE0_41680 [Streptomyces sp. 900105755]|uniref:hypothetical protein n=1 Tax=Streptomyces sp. 900105755 TaxID=3154389 RepID=UPI003327B034